MATTKSDLPEKPSNVEREPLFLTGDENQFLFDNDDTIQIDNVHPLFDIPVMETYETFLDALDQNHADRTFQNNYDGIEVLCFKAENALSNTLTISQLEQQSIEYATASMTSAEEFSNYTDFTSTWFETFINHYNTVLHEETPEEFSLLRDSAIALTEKTDLEPELVMKTIATELGVEEPNQP